MVCYGLIGTVTRTVCCGTQAREECILVGVSRNTSERRHVALNLEGAGDIYHTSFSQELLAECTLAFCWGQWKKKYRKGWWFLTLRNAHFVGERVWQSPLELCVQMADGVGEFHGGLRDPSIPELLLSHVEISCSAEAFLPCKDA